MEQKLTIEITREILEKLYSRKNLSGWVEPINYAIKFAEIPDKNSLACFLAQIGHESGRLVYTKEIWGPTKQQLRYDPPSSLAKTLGNTVIGDGKKYAGRGLIQITGKHNYIETTVLLKLLLSHELDIPNFEIYPEKMQEPFWAALSAGLYWKTRNLNKYTNNFALLTKKINGGYNGLADRQLLYTKALILIGGDICLK